MSRRQFCVGPADVVSRLGWPLRTLSGSLAVAADPDLPCTVDVTPGATLVALGLLLDPDRPAATTAEILAGLRGAATTPETLAAATHRLGGRWVILADTPRRRFALADAGGLRPLVYTDASHDIPLCASQAAVLATLLPLRRDPEAQAFLARDYAQRDPDWWWPGDATGYVGVRALLPNHALDLDSRMPLRIWPSRVRQRRSASAVVEAAVPLLRGIILAAAAQMRLALPLTAGWDSRAILAAAAPIRDVLYVYTLELPSSWQMDVDRVIAVRLCARLGLVHHWARGFDEVPADRVTLSGHVSEVARRFYAAYDPGGPMSGARLARMAGMGHDPFAVAHFGAWLAEAGPVATKAGYDVRDLMYWEQRVGRWAAAGQAATDHLFERVSPFACRALLEVLLSAPVRARRGPDYPLYRRLVEALDPAVLAEPVNGLAHPGPLRRLWRLVRAWRP